MIKKNHFLLILETLESAFSICTSSSAIALLENGQLQAVEMHSLIKHTFFWLERTFIIRTCIARLHAYRLFSI